MSYKIEGTDLVISGNAQGISDSAYNGINDMRGVNIISLPDEAPISFASQFQSLSSLTGTITSIDTGTDIVTATITTGSVETYSAVRFTNSGGALPTPLVAGTTYWILYQSTNTFLIYSDCYCTNLVNLTTTGTGTNTFASINLGQVRYFEKTFGYCIDTNGRVWSPAYDGNKQYYVFTFMDNTITDGSGNGIIVYRGSGTQKYLFVFRNGQIDYTPCGDPLGIMTGGTSTSTVATNNSTWVSGWNPVTGSTTAAQTLNTTTATNNPHEALLGQDNVVYYCDSAFLGSLQERAGSTFDPTNTATYTWAKQALAIPKNDIAQCLEELNTNLLVGGLYNFIYPWDRLSTSFKYPIQIAEKGTIRMITVNTNTYIFAGNRGRIFVTNGSQAQLFKKIPDYILGIDPIFTFYGVAYNKNQLYFGCSASINATPTGGFSGTFTGSLLSNATSATLSTSWVVPNVTNIQVTFSNGDKRMAVVSYGSTSITWTIGLSSSASSSFSYVANSNYAGLWAIDIDTKALRVPVLCSTNTGTVTSIFTLPSSVIGYSIFTAWFSTTTNFGIDGSLSTPYTSYGSSYIVYDMIPVGQFLTKKTFSNLEFKLAAPLASGEAIKISYRTNMNENFTLIDENSTVGAISGVMTPNFEASQWLQFRVDMKSTNTNPSFVRLTEIRLRM